MTTSSPTRLLGLSRLASLSVLTAICAVPLLASAYEIKPPWRSDSLPADAYMRTSGHGLDYNCGDNCGMDISPIRFNAATSSWTPYKTSASASPPPHEDWLGFGMQLYSPVDGEVIGCFWNMPEDLPGGAEPAACANTPEGTCVKSGNHLFIRTTDGHVLYLAHLQRGSIPASLCPIPGTATTGLTLTGSSGAPCNIAGRGGVWNGARPDKLPGFTSFPKVKKGDPIARIGSSGASDTPHLHMSMYSLMMDSNGDFCVDGEPYEFSEAFSQQLVSNAPADANGWQSLAAEELTFDVNNITHLLWGDPLGPRIDKLGIEDGTRPALATTPAGGVLAYRNLAGKLETIGFNVDLGGQLDPGVGDEDVAILDTDVDVAPINTSEPHAVVAVIDASARLSVIPYFVESDADVILGTKRTESSTGAQLVKATASPNNNGIVAAIKNSLDGISVVNYETTRVGTNISIARDGSDLTAPVVKDFDLATIVAGRSLVENTGAFKGVVTAERRADDTLWLQSWRIDSTGSVVTAVDEEQVKNTATNTSFTVSDVDVTVTGSFGGRDIILVSSALLSTGNLRVQSWTVSTTGQLARVEQYDGGGPVSQVSSSRSGSQDAVIGMRQGPTQHTLLSFHVTSAGVLRRVGTHDAESLSTLAVSGRSGKDDVIALFPDSTGELQLVRYISNYLWTL